METEKVRWIYVGKRISFVGNTIKVHFAYRKQEDELSANDENLNDIYFGKSLGSFGKRGDIVGGIYEGEVERKEDGTIVANKVGKWSYMGIVENDVLRASWKAMNDAAAAEYDAFESKKKVHEKDPLLDYLSPVRDAYRRTNTAGKRALIAKVLEYIGR